MKVLLYSSSCRAIIRFSLELLQVVVYTVEESRDRPGVVCVIPLSGLSVRLSVIVRFAVLTVSKTSRCTLYCVLSSY